MQVVNDRIQLKVADDICHNLGKTHTLITEESSPQLTKYLHIYGSAHIGSELYSHVQNGEYLDSFQFFLALAESLLSDLKVKKPTPAETAVAAISIAVFGEERLGLFSWKSCLGSLNRCSCFDGVSATLICDFMEQNHGWLAFHYLYFGLEESTLRLLDRFKKFERDY